MEALLEISSAHNFGACTNVSCPLFVQVNIFIDLVVFWKITA